jgi:DegT/DnrJ/EryC1/StrS aminotransferase family protein
VPEPLEKIRVSMPSIGLDTAERVVAALDMRWLGMGPLVKEFEERIAAFLGGVDPNVVCTNASSRSPAPVASSATWVAADPASSIRATVSARDGGQAAIPAL